MRSSRSERGSRLRSTRGERELLLDDFLVGPFSTALEPDELLLQLEVPEQPAGTRVGFAEHSRIHGDFALAGAAVVARPDGLVVSLLAVAERPLRVDLPAEATADPREAASLAVRDLEPGHRRALAEALVRRALEEAE